MRAGVLQEYVWLHRRFVSSGGFGGGGCFLVVCFIFLMAFKPPFSRL